MMKRCAECKQQKPLTDFSPRKGARDRLRGQCKECRNRQEQERLRRVKLYPPKQREAFPEGFKRCAKCGKIKLLAEFGPDKRATDERKSQCKACLAEQQRQYYTEHPEEVAAYRKERREYIAEYNRTKNSDRGRNRLARLAGLPATLTLLQWQEILEEWGFRCAYCNRDESQFDGTLQREHIIPVDQGGGYISTNIVPACPECNNKKGARTPEQAGMSFMFAARDGKLAVFERAADA